MFEKLTEKLAHLGTFKFVLTISIIVLFKTGLCPIGSEFVGWMRETSRALPIATMYLVSSPIPLGIMRILNYPNDFVWWSVGLILYIFWIGITYFLLFKKFPNHKKLVALLFAASTPFASAATLIGHIDIFTLLGVTIAVLATFKGHVWIGALLAAGGNADQAIASSVCLLFLFAAKSETAKKIAFPWVASALTCYLSVHIFLKIDSVNDPKQVILGEIKHVTFHSLGSWDLILYSQMGLLWIPWIFLVLPSFQDLRQKLLVLLGVIVLPFFMSFFILDGTKIGTTVGFLTLLISGTDYLTDFKCSPKYQQQVISFGFIFIVFFPTILVGNGGLLRLPYRKILEQLNVI